MKRTIEEYQKWVAQGWLGTAPDPGTPLNEDDLQVMSLGLAEEAGEVLGKLKKRIRGDGFDPNALKLELGDTLFYWCQLCTYFKIPIQDVLQANIDKCESRRARGVTKGSGDDR